MQIFHGSTTLAAPFPDTVLTMGNFDGVHRGHQAILARVAAAARTCHGTPMVYTFDPHPARVLAPERSFDLLQTIAQRTATLAAHGMAVVCIEPFTHAFARMAPEAFLTTVLLQRIRPVRIIVGYDFTFGNHRAGRGEHLKAFGDHYGIPVEIVEPLFDGEVLLSSSVIRQCVAEGRLAEATSALGRPYQITGMLVRGRGIGTQLGFPTANLLPENTLLPPEGVYVTTAWLEDQPHPAATYIGRNPTFGGVTTVVETHLLDFAGRIDSRTCGVEGGTQQALPVGGATRAPVIDAERMAIDFHARLRGDIRFETVETLKLQIGKDVDAAKTYHANSKSEARNPKQFQNSKIPNSKR